jgi:hypothetical protein
MIDKGTSVAYHAPTSDAVETGCPSGVNLADPTKEASMAQLPASTQLSKLGFNATELKGLSPRVKRLTRRDLVALVDNPQEAPAKLKLTFQDLQGLHAVAAKAARQTTTGGGGSGDGGIRCCCCIACCCCCCAVAVTK